MPWDDDIANDKETIRKLREIIVNLTNACATGDLDFIKMETKVALRDAGIKERDMP